MHLKCRGKIRDTKRDKDISLENTDKCMPTSTGLKISKDVGKCSNGEDLRKSNKLIEYKKEEMETFSKLKLGFFNYMVTFSSSFCDVAI